MEKAKPHGLIFLDDVRKGDAPDVVALLDISQESGKADKARKWGIPVLTWKDIVDWTIIQVAKTGALTPVAEPKPVEIAGTTVARARLHNRDELVRRGIQLVDELKELGLNLGQPVDRSSLPAEGKLIGRTLVVTGTMVRMKRDQIEQLIRDHGGKASGSVSKKTDFVVAGDAAGSKLTRAQELGVKVLSEDEFLAMVENRN